MASTSIVPECTVHVLFLRKKVVKVHVKSDFTVDDMIQSVVNSDDVHDLRQEMSIYHPDTYLASSVEPILTVPDIENCKNSAALLEDREIYGLVGFSRFLGSFRWPFEFQDHEIPFLIDGPETIASLIVKARAEKRPFDSEDLEYSNEVTRFWRENDCYLEGTRWDESRPLLQAHLPTTPITRIVIKYSSSDEARIWTLIRSLKDDSSSAHHVGSLVMNPIAVSGVDGALFIMHDHGDNLLDYSPRSAPVSPRIWAQQLCDAVCFLHSHRIVHRDIKPDNITIHPETHALTLVDFSTAKHVAEHESFVMGRGVGTKKWVHPVIRTWLDEGHGELYDARQMDMWAVGKVMKWLGRRKYVGKVKNSSLRLGKLGDWLMQAQTSDEGEVLERLRKLWPTKAVGKLPLLETTRT